MRASGLAGEWSDFVLSTRFEDLPQAVVDRTKLAILDSLAVSCAGVTTEIAAATERYVAAVEAGPDPAPGPSTGFSVFPYGVRVRDWELAGLVQGVRAYGHLYGDTSLRSVSHPGPVVVSSAITTAQQTGASGRDVITAVALGYQVLEAFAVELNGRPPRMALQIRGFRPTAVCGPLAAAATAGRLVGADAGVLANALGVAANAASGLRPNEGDPAAAILLQTGHAVRAGHGAVRLAQAGVKGGVSILEGPGGYLEAFTGRKGVTVAPQSSDWAILDTAVKLHATAHTLAPVVDMVLDLQRRHGFKAEDVTAVEVRVPVAHLKISGRDKPFPVTTSEAVGHYGFGVAAALVSGDYLWPAVLERSLHDPRVVALAGLVTILSDPEHTADFDAGEKMWPAGVVVRAGGAVLSASVDRPDGVAFSDRTLAAVTRKFEVLSADLGDRVDADAVRDFVIGLDDVDAFHEGLTAAVGAAPRGEG
jgi:2-methylcitrate dehydratase PrpD